MKLTKSIISLTLCLVLLSSCRDKIVHELGVVKIENSDPTVDPNTKVWQHVDGSPDEIVTLEVYNSHLYMGGHDPIEKEAILMKYDGTTFTKGVSGKFISGPIYDLHIYQDKLWACGVFSYYEGLNRYQNILNIQNNKVSGLEFGSFLTSYVFKFQDFDGKLLVNGYFTKNHDGIKTKFIEQILNGTNVGFLDGVEREIFDCAEFQGKLFIAGQADLAPGVHLCGYFDGTTLKNSGAESNNGILDEGWALETYKGKLYFAHNKEWATQSTFLRSFDGTKWENIEVVDLSSDEQTYLKEVDGKLYFMGRGLSLDGKFISNVISFDGKEWSAIGALNIPIVDIAVYKGHLYAATPKGLFKFH